MDEIEKTEKTLIYGIGQTLLICPGRAQAGSDARFTISMQQSRMTPQSESARSASFRPSENFDGVQEGHFLRRRLGSMAPCLYDVAFGGDCFRDDDQISPS